MAINKAIGTAVGKQLRNLVYFHGLEYVYSKQKSVREHLNAAAPPPDLNKHEVDIVFCVLDEGIPYELICAPDTQDDPSPLFFEEVMGSLATRGLSWTEAVWGVEAWERALENRLPGSGTGLAFGEPQQDRKAYLALKKVKRMPLPRIEAKIKKMFGRKLPRRNVDTRDGGYQYIPRNDCELYYEFSRAEDGREYVDWNLDHRHKIPFGATSGRIYEDGKKT